MKTLIDIKEVAKTMTREEFIEEIQVGRNGKLKEPHNCPEFHNLNSFDIGRSCVPDKECFECWTAAVKDIKFKDDMEVEVNE